MKISLDIISLDGKKVRNLVSGFQPQGYYTPEWDGCNDSGAPVPDGVYLCLLSADDSSAACRIIKS